MCATLTSGSTYRELQYSRSPIYLATKALPNAEEMADYENERNEKRSREDRDDGAGAEAPQAAEGELLFAAVCHGTWGLFRTLPATRSSRRPRGRCVTDVIFERRAPGAAAAGSLRDCEARNLALQ